MLRIAVASTNVLLGKRIATQNKAQKTVKEPTKDVASGIQQYQSTPSAETLQEDGLHCPLVVNVLLVYIYII